VFADQLFQITRRSPRLAAGVVTASLTLSTLTYAQGDSPQPLGGPAIEVTRSSDDKTSLPKRMTYGRLTGTIMDVNGAVIPGATVTIFSVDVGKTASTTTDADGIYRFETLESGKYRIETESPGFRKSVREVAIASNDQTVADASLDIGFEITVDVIADVALEAGMMGGVMVSIGYSTPLAQAVAHDDIDEARDLLIKGARVNGRDDNYDKITPLFIAVENGNIEMVRMLLDFGAKVNARDNEKQAPIFRLDDDATPELVELLVRFGAKIDRVDSDRNTPLIVAAGLVKPEVLQSLIGSGADVYAANKEGYTALMRAAENDDLESVRILIEAGAEVNARNKTGESAHDLTSSDDVEALLELHGAVVKVEDDAP
jgi:hypothetical protein